MAAHLKRAANLFGYSEIIATPWHELRREHILALRHKLGLPDANRVTGKGLSPTTINTLISAVKGVCKEAWLKKMMSGDDFDGIRQIPRLKSTRIAKGKPVKMDRLKALLAKCGEDRTAKGIRDITLITLMIECRLRRSEAVAINLEDIDFEETCIRVVGKGNKERLVFFSDNVGRYIEFWVDQLRGESPGPLFTRILKSEEVTQKRLSHHGVYHIIRERQFQTFIEHFSPHDLRRTFATEMLKLGTDLITLRDMLGHQSISTTQLYTLLDSSRLKEAAKKFTALCQIPHDKSWGLK